MLANRIILAAGGGRKLDQYTKSLLHFNGVNGSTNFKDETGKIWTPAGNAKISTTQKKFGGASGYFDGSSDYISTPHHDDLILGSQNFTIDFWIYPYGLISDDSLPILGKYGSGVDASTKSFYIQIYHYNPELAYNIGSNTYSLRATSTINNTTWSHIAFARSGSTLYAFVNGIKSGTRAISGAINSGTIRSLEIGRTQSGYDYEGYIDEFRLSVGIARWTDDFTPPTREY